MSVTGIDTSETTARRISPKRSGRRISSQPPPRLTTFGTGQPQLTSSTSAPLCSTRRAARTIRSTSAPKICTAIGRSSARKRIMPKLFAFSRVNASTLMNSVSMSPTARPLARRTMRRKAESVTPDIGASRQSRLDLDGPDAQRLARIDLAHAQNSSSTSAIGLSSVSGMSATNREGRPNAGPMFRSKYWIG